jgi:hypothetical protein
MNANSTRTVVVEAGGTQVVGHVGLHALGAFADRLGVGETLLASGQRPTPATNFRRAMRR